MYDYNARFYSPVLGRFISPDTIVPEPYNLQSWNRYAYALNNPVRYSDPTGHLSEEELNDYFDYSGAKDEIREAMIKDKWQEDMVDWLLDDDTHFGDVFTYQDQNGVKSEAMLGLFETGEAGSGMYVGGFYGLNGDRMGEEVSRSNISFVSDHTPGATRLEELYKGNYMFLPRKGGTDGRNYYDPVKYSDKWTAGFVSAVGTGVSVIGTVAVLATCANPAGALACLGGTAGVISTGGTVLGTIGYVASPNVSIDYPLLRIPNIYDNAPNISGFGRPNGYYYYH